MNKKIILLLVIIIGSAYPIQVYVSDQVSISKFEDIQLGLDVWTNQTIGSELEFINYLNWTYLISKDKISVDLSWDHSNPELQFVNITIVIFNPRNAEYRIQINHKSGPEVEVHKDICVFTGGIPSGAGENISCVQIYPGAKNPHVTLEIFRE